MEPLSWVALPFETSPFQGVGQDYAAQFRNDLSRLPDMERLLVRLLSSCDENKRRSSVVLYEDAPEFR